MKVVNFALLLLALALGVALAQPGQQEQSLDRQTIEWILQNIDEDCKEEMQNAMANQGDLSDRCKFTIQKMLVDKAKGGSSAAAAAEPISFFADPITHVFLFLGVLFAAVGFYSYYAYDAKVKAGLVVDSQDKAKRKGSKYRKRKKVPYSVGE